MDIVLEAKHIDKYFRKPVDFHVLKAISFQIKKGEFVSIMGKSGCGKSTLLYILSTMDTDYEGQLYLNGQLVPKQNQEHLAYLRNKHIGFVFQFHYLLSECTVLENVMLPAKKLGEFPLPQIKINALEKLKMLNIEHLAYKKASQVSGGEKQRVAIARALINNPTLILGDEPTGNLDSHNAQNVFNIFKTLCTEQGLSLLIVTHDEDFAKKTDRIIEMEDGIIRS
ncbi:ABC transporter ATP-binding protein [Winogradskyella rapida]|uniref:ABC transporter ATP-binding protein n=1 Tax=Winogradskyella rapida TaxID=549701 RepID=A0ABW3KU53_9FLAO